MYLTLCKGSPAGVAAFRRNNLAQAHKRLQESKRARHYPENIVPRLLRRQCWAESELHQGHSEPAFTYAEEGMQASEGINDRWCKRHHS